MIRTKTRWRIAVTLTILNLTFIWTNSLLPAEVSSAFSRSVRWLLNQLFSGGAGDGSAGHGYLRKLAHMLEFTALGMCLRWMGGMAWGNRWKAYALPVLGGFLAGCVDETIQCFVPGRAPAILDVGIDTAGVLLGAVFLSAANYFIHLEEKNNEKNRCTCPCAGDGGGDGSRMREEEREG